MKKGTTSLEEFLGLISEKFPKIQKKKLEKIIYTIWCRQQSYSSIGFSRLESCRFGVSEKTLQRLIAFLIDYGFLIFVSKKPCKRSEYLCNTYRVAGVFFEFFKNFFDETKKIFERISPLAFMQANFHLHKKRPSRYEYIVNGIKYIVSKGGKYAGMIYDTSQNRIISPLSLTR